MTRVIRIDDTLLDALGDRWPFIPAEFPNQTFEAWLASRMREYNEYGYPRDLGAELDPPSLWDLVHEYPPGDFDDFVNRRAEDLRAVGGTFVQSVRDLHPLAMVAIRLGT